MELEKLIDTAKSINKLLDGDAFSTALDAIAGVDIKTAKLAIKNHKNYANPREALNAALDNLNHAHLALEEKCSKWHVRYTQGFLLNFQLETDAYVCCLIAILHRALGNKKELIKEAFDWAVKAFFDIPCSSFRAALDLLKPIFWLRMITNKSKIDSDDIKKCLYIIQEQEGFAPKIKITDIFPDDSDDSDSFDSSDDYMPQIRV
jgi:hypothetical protein